MVQSTISQNGEISWEERSRIMAEKIAKNKASLNSQPMSKQNINTVVEDEEVLSPMSKIAEIKARCKRIQDSTAATCEKIEENEKAQSQ